MTEHLDAWYEFDGNKLEALQNIDQRTEEVSIFLQHELKAFFETIEFHPERFPSLKNNKLKINIRMDVP